MAKEFKFDTLLDDGERNCLQRIAADTNTINALKKLFLFGVYYNGTLHKGMLDHPFINFALSIDPTNSMKDEDLGRILRAKQEGVTLVELSFKELEKLKPIAINKEDLRNPGK